MTKENFDIELLDIQSRFHVEKMSQYYQDARTRIQAVTDLSILWFKSMYLISGGAIVGLIAVLDPERTSLFDMQLLGWGFAGLIGSIVLTTIALYIGYIGQDIMHGAELRSANCLFEDNTGGQSEWPSAIWEQGSKVTIAAVFFAGLAIISQAAGLVCAGVSSTLF